MLAHLVTANALGEPTHTLEYCQLPYRPGCTGKAEAFDGHDWVITGWLNEQLDQNPHMFRAIRQPAPFNNHFPINRKTV